MSNVGDTKSTMALVTFTRFPDLPPEIRLMVWERTWPEPRIIEPVLIQYARPDGGTATIVRLKPRCALSPWLARSEGPHHNRPTPSEPCPDPVSLRVNAESRAHTLESYFCMQHSPDDAHSFYFCPRRDCLRFGEEPMLGFNRTVMLAASGEYDGCWERVETVLGGPRMRQLYNTCVMNAKGIFGVLPG